MNPDALRINGGRLRRSLEEMARIGATPGGGVNRLTLTGEDKRSRDLFLSWLKELQLDIVIDEMGNIFGTRPGRREDLPPVLSGSHIDSQPFGGRFDGMLGVMGALEALRTIDENKIETDRSIIIVDWTNEEGSRFSPAMMGSGVWTGRLEKNWVYERTDVQGKKFGEELKRIGYRGTHPARKWPLRSYFELHIEQGPVLEKEGKKIGIPEGIVALRWYDVEVEGVSNQTGPTPMAGRRDALCAAAEMILLVNQTPEKMGGNMVATVGEIHNFPNSRNIIPGRVRFTVDLRSWDDDVVRRAAEGLERDFRKLAEKRGCPLTMHQLWDILHTPFDEKLKKMIWETSDRLGLSGHSLVSGAGHDAAYLGRVAPTAMIFVPSIGGRSHVEVEETSWQDCEAGTNVLLHCLLQSAGAE